jgi:hypothetical protein
MPTQVQAPDGQIIEFPDSMKDPDIEAAMGRLYPRPVPGMEQLAGKPKGHTPGQTFGPQPPADDENKPVGTAFQQNVRPTGQERNKGDLASSAHEQLQDIKSIVQKRQDIFGPAAGRKTEFTVWLGSQDPDAQRFKAARTIAADHLAGVFGGRSEAALSALDSAIGHYKDNPDAILKGIDQLDKANTRFSKVGTPKTAGSNAAKDATVEPIHLKDGRVLTPHSQADADAFRKDHPELLK